MTNRLNLADLMHAGRFADAISLSRRNQKSSPQQELWSAEALLRVGEWENAAKRIERLISAGSREHKAAAMGLRAELRGYRADSENAEKEFRRAIQLAVSSSDRTLAALLKVRMLAFVGEVYSENRAERIANDARDEALAVGDERLLAAYHVMAAKSDATRGRLSAARMHQELASEHLRRNPNAWMSAGLKLSESGTAFLMTDLATALDCAIAAEEEASRSGDLWSRAAAAANLGYLHLYLGHSNLAEAQLIRARELGKRLPVLQVGSLDSWAQLCLIRGMQGDATLAIEEVDRVIEANPALRGSWYELGSRITKIRLFRAAERWPEAVKEATAAVALAKSRADINAAAHYLCSAAEGLLRCGDRRAAREAFAEAVLTRPAPVSVRIECNRVRALLHEAAGEQAAAIAALRLAADLATDVRDAVALADVHRTIKVHSTDEDSSESSTPVGVISSLIDAADRPRVLGLECLRLLSRLGFISAGAVITEDANEESVLDSLNWTTADHAAIGTAVVPVSLSVKLALRLEGTFQATHAVSAIKSFLELVRLARHAVLSLPETQSSAVAYRIGSPDVFTSSAMADVVRTAKRIAPVNVTVLLTGETGVGKEVLARTIHDQSPRAKAPFVPFNCSAIPREMLESQLFGYRKGAFTGALEAFSGVIRSAEPGTLFLDEVGDLPLDLQPKLLRFLEASEVHPLGEPRPISVNVRIIAATNADLEARIREHKFREDLYYRLNTIQIEIPPLRRRTEEIPHLAQTLLTAHAEEFRKGSLRLSADTTERLIGYPWPGNIRELSNEMRRVAALAEPASIVDPSLLSARVGGAPRARRPSAARSDTIRIEQPLTDAVSALEKTMIERALQVTDGKLDDAARLLGISRKGLFLKRRRYGIRS